MNRDYAPDLGFFAAAGAPLGTRELVLPVAGARVLLRGLDDRTIGLFEGQLPARSTEGAMPAAEGRDFTVLAARATVPAFLHLERGEDYRIENRVLGEDVVSCSYGYAARIRMDAREADLRLTEQPDWLLTTSVVNFLRVLYSRLAFEAGGFLLHASAVVREGRAWLFFGPSGIGKTTVARLCEPGPVLNDDLVFVSASGGEVRATGLPLSGEYRGGRSLTGEAFPVAGACRLVQASDHRLEGLSSAEAVVAVLASIPYGEVRVAGDNLIDRAAAFARSVPVRRLHFRRDPGFWDLLLPPREDRPGGPPA